MPAEPHHTEPTPAIPTVFKAPRPGTSIARPHELAAGTAAPRAAATAAIHLLVSSLGAGGYLVGLRRCCGAGAAADDRG